jgi:hypothetical protein
MLQRCSPGIYVGCTQALFLAALRKARATGTHHSLDLAFAAVMVVTIGSGRGEGRKKVGLVLVRDSVMKEREEITTPRQASRVRQRRIKIALMF